MVTGSIGPTLSVPRRLGRPVLVDTHNVEGPAAPASCRRPRRPGHADQAPLRPGHGGLRAPRAALERPRLRLLGGRGPHAARRRDRRTSPWCRTASTSRPCARRPRPDERLRALPRRPGLRRQRRGRAAGSPARSPPPCAGGSRALPDRGRGPRRLPDVRAELRRRASRCGRPSPTCGWSWPARGRLVPLRSGGGTRLKILEAFGAGRAVVRPTLGAEGIEAVQPPPPADRRLGRGPGRRGGRPAGEPERRRELAGEARRLAEERYGWDADRRAAADDVEAVVAP